MGNCHAKALHHPPKQCNVILWRGESRIHRVDTEMRCTESLPRGDIVCPLIFGNLCDAQTRLDAYCALVTSRLAGIAPKLLDHSFGLLIRRHLGEPTITKPSSSLQCRIRVTANPDRNGALHG